MLPARSRRAAVVEAAAVASTSRSALAFAAIASASTTGFTSEALAAPDDALVASAAGSASESLPAPPMTGEDEASTRDPTSACAAAHSRAAVPALARRCSRLMWFSGGRPTQARSTLHSASRCRNSALITGVPEGTSGALSRKDSRESTEWKRSPSSSPSVAAASASASGATAVAAASAMALAASAGVVSRSRMRSHSSAITTRSMISGAASRLSSHVLCMAMVLVPPMKMREVYSSSARLLSPTCGTYLMTTQWSGCSPSAYIRRLEATMSSTTLLLLISLERNCLGALRFLPSLLPRWL
mmetsp:Transcript_5615/g.15469  ORF Transcript_5615/g.15469 Transcript_5615/m.15469 type:complete len:301 (+) Transcript_5615:134-1036(+)